MRVLDHVERGRDLADVSRDADHVDHALVFGEDVLVIIGPLGIGHDGQLQGGFIIADDAPDIVFQAILPLAVFARDNDLAGGLVTDLHVIDAGFDAGCIDCFHDLIIEMVVVHQSPSRIVQSRTLISGRHETHFPAGLSFGLVVFIFVSQSIQEKVLPQKM